MPCLANTGSSLLIRGQLVLLTTFVPATEEREVEVIGGRSYQVRATFNNPLEKPLTKVVFHIEGTRLTPNLKIPGRWAAAVVFSSMFIQRERERGVNVKYRSFSLHPPPTLQRRRGWRRGRGDLSDQALQVQALASAQPDHHMPVPRTQRDYGDSGYQDQAVKELENFCDFCRNAI